MEVLLQVNPEYADYTVDEKTVHAINSMTGMILIKDVPIFGDEKKNEEILTKIVNYVNQLYKAEVKKHG